MPNGHGRPQGEHPRTGTRAVSDQSQLHALLRPQEKHGRRANSTEQASRRLPNAHAQDGYGKGHAMGGGGSRGAQVGPAG
jgi:hypothetical protein